jgi:hypothetical protein
LRLGTIFRGSITNPDAQQRAIESAYMLVKYAATTAATAKTAIVKPIHAFTGVPPPAR